MLLDAFENQAISCRRLDSPFMGRLFETLGAIWPNGTALARKLARFEGDIGPSGHSLPLRLAGGLHALVLNGADPALGQIYPPNEPDEETFAAGILSALARNEAFLLDWVDSPPQTNEVRRSAVLIAGANVATSYHDLPISLSELGASGGLNLNWDRFDLNVNGTVFAGTDPVLTLVPDWQGPQPPKRRPVVAERAGVDLNPLDPTDPDALLRLTAYLWADQPERIARTRAAAAMQTTRVERGDAIDWLAGRLQAAPDGHLHLIQHTVAWQYFPQAVQERGTALIEEAGQAATPDRPLAWLAMETDGDKTGGIGAAITLRIWPENLSLSLGRADFHGRWIRWTAPNI
ncbi:MAG: DUF2332 family protein [Pseudomonadota bacterium]